MEQATVYVFLAIISIAFLKYIIWGDNQEKILQKIIGGFSVLLVATASRDRWAICTSILIAGLIIASEEFMMFIAAVMKSQGDKVADTVSALRLQKASPEEIKEKANKDDKEIKGPGNVGLVSGENVKSPDGQAQLNLELPTMEHTDEPKRKEGKNERTNLRIRKSIEIEEVIHGYLKGEFGDLYEPHVKFVNSSGIRLIVDGVIKKGEKVKQVVEIRYISPSSFPNVKFFIQRIREKLARLNLKKRVLMIIVSDHLTPDDARAMHDSCIGFAYLRFFTMEDNKPTLVLPREIEKVVDAKPA